MAGAGGHGAHAYCLGGATHTGLPAPVLGVHGTASPSWLVAATEAVAKAVPDGEVTGLAGGFHEVPAATLAPVLAEFYLRNR